MTGLTEFIIYVTKEGGPLWVTARDFRDAMRQSRALGFPLKTITNVSSRPHKGQFTSCDELLAEYREEIAGLQDEPGGDDPMRRAVLKVWDDNNGWIPGCAYRELAVALGVSEERLLACAAERKAKP